jgi:nicotinamidase-related amidase
VSRALLLVDVIKGFRHEGGDRLLSSYRQRHEALLAVIGEARKAGEPVVYANDGDGVWDSDAPRLVRQAIEQGQGGELVAAVAPEKGDTFVLKPRYSAFDATPLNGLLREELGVEELAVAGTATEMCVFQTVTDALRVGFRASVLASACATVDERNERLALDYLKQVLGVEIVRR